MKSIHEHIEVDVRLGGRVPRRFRWERRTYHVRRLLSYWILQTRWWGREEKRIYYRLETNRGIVEIYRAVEIVRPASCYPASCYTGAAPDSIDAPPDSNAAPSSTAAARPDAIVAAPSSALNEPCSVSDGANYASASAPPDHQPAAAANPLPDPRSDRPPLPIEGDTHTRERRRTDAAYRPDVRIEERARRQAAAQKASDTELRVRWVLSKILD